MRERDGTHDEPLVHFDGFVCSCRDGIFVDILKGRRYEILCEGRRYHFGSETLRGEVDDGSRKQSSPFERAAGRRTKIWRISLRLGLFEARIMRFPASLLIPGMCSA